MGEAMIQGLLSKSLVKASEITVAEPRKDRSKELQQHYDVKITSDNRRAAQASKIIVFSIKPQDLGSVIEELSGSLHPDQLVISIVAGAHYTIGTGYITTGVIRVMPNTPAQIGEGISVWTATPGVDKDQLSQTRSILQAFGKEIYVKEEKFLDMATAVSGTAQPTSS